MQVKTLKLIKLEVLKGAMSQQFCCFGSEFRWNRYLVALLMHKMFRINCEVNIKWNALKKSASHINFFVIEIASKLAKFSINFSNFNPFPSLPSVATNGRKQNKRHTIVLINKPRPLFLEFSGVQDKFRILKKY